MKKNKTGLFLILTLFATILQAQNGEKVYRFLNLPTSTRVNALGGSNVSLVETDVALVFHNPALLGDETDMNLNVNYMSYLGDIGVGSVIFGKIITPISSFAVGVNYVDYGNFQGMSDENISEGSFGAKDIAVNGTYSRDLTEKLRGGVTAKVIYSSYETYSSAAIGFDVGLSYYNKAEGFSSGIVIKNVGTQISSFNEEKIGLPWDIQLGFSKKMNHSPLRISATAIYLSQWDFDKVDAANGLEDSKDNFIKTAFKHLVIGVDYIPSQNFWIGAGYSPKVNSDMKLQEGNSWGGWSLGAGFRVSKFSLGFSMAPYQPSATSYHFSLGVDLSKF